MRKPSLNQSLPHVRFMYYVNFKFNMTNESCDTTEIPGAPPIINESLTNEHCSSFPVNRLSKSEKKALKAARLMERRKFHAEQYKNRRKVHNEELLKSKMKEFDGETFVSHCKGPLKSETAAKMDHALEFGLNVCIDLSFDVEHNERERISVAKQMSLAYGVVKKARAPLHLHLCSFVEGSTLSEKLHNQGCKNWKISFHDETSWNLFPVESLIILSPDAVEPLETLEPSKVQFNCVVVLIIHHTS